MMAAPSVIAQPKVQWRMSTAWPPALDVMQGSAQRLAKVVEEVSYEGPDLGDKRVTIDGRFVRDKLGPIMQREDLSKFIL